MPACHPVWLDPNASVNGSRAVLGRIIVWSGESLHFVCQTVERATGPRARRQLPGACPAANPNYPFCAIGCRQCFRQAKAGRADAWANMERHLRNQARRSPVQPLPIEIRATMPDRRQFSWQALGEIVHRVNEV